MNEKTTKMFAHILTLTEAIKLKPTKYKKVGLFLNGSKDENGKTREKLVSFIQEGKAKNDEFLDLCGFYFGKLNLKGD